MKLNFISIKNIVSGTTEVATRFPLSMITACIGTILGIVLLHNQDQFSLYTKLLMTLGLGLPIFTAIVLFGEKKQWALKNKLITDSAAVLFLILYYVLLPENFFQSGEVFIFRYAMWMIGFFLLIMFIPFIQKGDETIVKTFWHYNKTLALSLFLTMVWAAALQAGISIAMASVGFLFEITIVPERYMELWIVVVGIFSTTFFLSRVPRNVDSFAETKTYPKELRLFFQYVLCPLVAIYFLILYAYVIRILVTLEWPKGTLAYMILGFSFLGILAYAISRPLIQEVRWVGKASQGFFIVLIPQIGMLFWALWFRITEYSFTENRYFVFVFGWWLLAMAIYFLFSRKKDIRLIPVSIFIIVFLASFGPWGAFAVSEKSQTNRLKKLLLKHEVLVEGKIKKTSKQIPLEDRKEISAGIRYLVGRHGTESIQPFFNENLKELTCEDDAPTKDLRHLPTSAKPAPCEETSYHFRYIFPKKITEELIGIQYVEQWEYLNNEGDRFYLNINYEKQEAPLNISQYDYMIQPIVSHEGLRKESAKENSFESSFAINDVPYVFKVDNTTGKIIVLENSSTIAEVDFQNFLKEILAQGQMSNVSRDRLKIEFKNDQISFAVYFEYISGFKGQNGKYYIESFNGKLFFTLY